MDNKLNNFSTFIQKAIPDFPETELSNLAAKAAIRKFKKNELFVKEDEICQHLLFIHSGMFRYYFLHEGEDITKDFAVDALNPFCTSYTSFMLQKPSEIWIEALEPSEVWVWNKSDITPLLKDNLAWLHFFKLMSDRLFYRKEQKEIELLKLSAEERYRQFLIGFPGVSQRVPQYHIATYLGIKPESLSRIRAKLAGH